MLQLKTIYENEECKFEYDFIENETKEEYLDKLCLFEDNYEQCIKLKHFLRENTDYAISNNLIDILSDKISEYSESWHILLNFYSLLKVKFNIILSLKTWKETYINNLFWRLTTKDQINFLTDMKNYFLSIYDCSLGGCVYHIKLLKIFESKNYNYSQIMDDIEDRLKKILKLVGPKILEHLNIQLITVNELYDFTTDQIFKYFSVIFTKIKELLEITLNQFKDFDSICEEMDVLLSK